jgi:hypothetical protein
MAFLREGCAFVDNRFKKLLTAGTLLALLALDWAALHDIMKGEPDPHAEYAMLLVSLAAFVAMALLWHLRQDSA